MTSDLRLLVVSSRPIVRAGVSTMLGQFRERAKVVGELEQTWEVPGEAGRSRADAVLFDVSVAGDGLEEVESLVQAAAGTSVVVLARRHEARFTWLVLQRGAAGFLLETVTAPELVGQLELVRQGGLAVDSALAGGPTPVGEERLTPPWPGAHLGLTQDQSRILELVAHGYSTAGAGRQVGMTHAEVRALVRSAYRRLDASDRSEALARLAREGLFR